MILNRNIILRDQEAKLVLWCAPNNSFIKLNVDGAHDINCLFGCGGIVRDGHGSWIGGFSICIGSYSPLMDEIWSIFIGLKMVKELGFRRIEVETDSSRAVDCISRNNRMHMAAGIFLSQIKLLMTSFEVVDIHHNYRETNSCARLFALEAKKFKGDTTFYGKLPSWLVHLVEKDSRDEPSSRFVAL